MSKKIDEADVLRRAMAAYFRSGSTTTPSSSSGVTTVDGLHYVVLRHAAEILAVYRVRNDLMLKGLKRWPPEIH